MKTKLVVLALSLVATASMGRAGELIVGKSAQRPEAIVCKVWGGGGAFPKTVTISALNTDRPESTLPDTGLSDLSSNADVAKTGIWTAFFSNECDNGYNVALKEKDLEALAAGARQTIRGQIDGGSSDKSGKGALFCKLQPVKYVAR